jgi:hypothetical protein
MLSANVPLPLRGEKISHHHWRGIFACRHACIGHDDASLLYRLQEMLDGALADLAAMPDSLLDRFAKMIPDQDARQPVFVSGLREAGIRPPHLMDPTASLLLVQQGRAAGCEADLVHLQNALQHLGRRAPFDTVGGVVFRVS